MADVEVRPLASLDEMREAAKLIDRVWGEARIVSPALLQALGTHGNPVLGAFRDEELVGAQMAFLGSDEEGTLLHSHITGVAPEAQREGVGMLLKLAQRDWCLERGIDRVTWTFDPLVARNAYFNLRKLGATCVRFHRDFYGPMEDAINRGDRSDRLEVVWELRSGRVEAAATGSGGPRGTGTGAVLLDRDAAGSPLPRPLPTASTLLVRIPEDHQELRQRDPALGTAWRDAVAGAFEQAFAADYRAVDFVPGAIGAYVMERT
jgi:predicted GNAT superfamily acetyltransferase